MTAERETDSVHIEPVHTGLGTSSCTSVKRVFLEKVNKIYGETKNGIILLIQLLIANLFFKKNNLPNSTGTQVNFCFKSHKFQLTEIEIYTWVGSYKQNRSSDVFAWMLHISHLQDGF